MGKKKNKNRNNHLNHKRKDNQSSNTRQDVFQEINELNVKETDLGELELNKLNSENFENYENDDFKSAYEIDEINEIEKSKKTEKNTKENDSVKEEIHFAEQIEKPQNKTKTAITFVIAVVIALFLTSIITSSTGFSKLSGFNWPLTRNNNDSNEENGLSESELAKSDEELLEKLNNNQEYSSEGVVNNATKSIIIRLPMLLSDNSGFDIDGKKLDCDVVVWIEKSVPYTLAPLNATYRELFNFDQELDFYVGNYVATQSNLNFDKATIENRIAKVYLTGSLNPFDGVCDEKRLENQITEAAIQFPTVDGAEIYLNGELY